MIPKIILAVFTAVTFSRSIPQETVSWSRSEPAQIYSRTGHHMEIFHSGNVVPSLSRPGLASLVEFLPVPGTTGKFIIRGIATGLYVRVKPVSRKLIGTIQESEATTFTLEKIQNNFESFKIAAKPTCRLFLAKNQYRIRCSPVKKFNKISFLSRKSHFPKFSPVSKYF